METRERIMSIVRDAAYNKAVEFKPEIDLEKDLLIDSLGKIEMIIKIEDEFQVEITDAEAEKILTIGDIDEAIKRHEKN